MNIPEIKLFNSPKWQKKNSMQDKGIMNWAMNNGESEHEKKTELWNWKIGLSSLLLVETDVILTIHGMPVKVLCEMKKIICFNF